MAEQEFLASFGVEIDESGVDQLQKTLESNRTLAEELAAAFDSARDAVSSFFSQLSASTLPTGELSPYQRLMDLSEEGFSFDLALWSGRSIRQHVSLPLSAWEIWKIIPISMISPGIHIKMRLSLL